MKIKEKAVKVKKWVSEHKGLIIGGTVAVISAGLCVKRINSVSAEGKKIMEAFENEPTDFGRNMLMQFVYEDSGELMEGAVPCTELYAKEMLELA